MGNLQTLLLLVKSLPLAYNRDLQEDKPPLFDSFDTIDAMLELAAPIVSQSVLQRDSIASRLEDGYLDATTLMEWMIRKGIPQRTAHHVVGAMVGEAIAAKLPLAKMPLTAFQKHAAQIDESVYDCLGTANAVNAFVSEGSTAPGEVRKQIERWKTMLAEAS
jgi:argininosuccinate lyase